jgi:hypothetical protein
LVVLQEEAIVRAMQELDDAQERDNYEARRMEAVHIF